MKLYSVIFLFFIISVISCTKNTGISVTMPDSHYVLDKIRYGNFVGIKLDGDSLIITGSQYNNGTYKYVDYLLSFACLFEDNNGNTLMAIPVSKEVNIVKVSREGKELINLLSSSDNPEYAKVITNLAEQGARNDGNIDTTKTDEILEGVNLPEAEYKELERLLFASSDSFISSEAIR